MATLERLRIKGKKAFYPLIFNLISLIFEIPRRLTKENMEIKGPFHHIHLLSENPHVTTQWYVHNLGAWIEDEADVRGSVRIRVCLGEAKLNISGLRPGKTVAMPGKGKVAGIDHFALTTDDIESLMHQLEENEVKIVEPIFTTTAGGRAFFIDGPDGVLIEILEA